MNKRHFLLFMVTLLSLISCRKELCYEHDSHSLGVRLDVIASWETVWQRDYGCNWDKCWDPSWECSFEDLNPEPAKGIRALAYRQDGTIYDERNFNQEGGRMYLSEENYSLLFYNNDTEYIVFDNLHSVAHTRATTRTLTRASYLALHDNERTINPPDMLYGHYLENYTGKMDYGADIYEATLKPLVYTYLIRYEFNQGQNHIALARGALAGMAESVYLHNGHTGSESATILYDCTVEQWGVETRVRTFGVPDYPGDDYVRTLATPPDYAINLEVKLYNGTIKTYEFDISEQIANQPRGGVITVSGLSVDDEEASGGFITDVEDWGDIIDVPLDL